MFNDNHDVSVLNSLIATTIDSARGYRKGAEDSDNERYRKMFLDRADERDEVVMELQAKVRTLGAEPADSGTALAGAHRAFLDIKAALTSSDDKAIVAEIERGEDHIKHKYEAAMEDTDVSPACRTGIEQCFSSIKIGHDQMRDLKHGLEGTTASGHTLPM